jgi:hypothetical protein
MATIGEHIYYQVLIGIAFADEADGVAIYSAKHLAYK